MACGWHSTMALPASNSNPLYPIFPTPKTIGNINAITRHNGRLYMATSQGLFYLQAGGTVSTTGLPASPKIQRIQGLFNECTALYSHSNALIVGTSGGIYALRNGNPDPIDQESLIHSFYAPEPQGNVLYAGSGEGLIKLKFDEAWSATTNFADITDEIRSIAPHTRRRTLDGH